MSKLPQLTLGQPRPNREPTIQVGLVKRDKKGNPKKRYTSRAFWGNYAGVSVADFAERHGCQLPNLPKEEAK